MGKELSDFASEEHPLRASRLPQLLRCAMSGLNEWLGESGLSSSAADTGSAVHMAAKIWHGPAERDTAIALEAMRQTLPKYPLADLGAAEQLFRCYAADPRNKEAEIVAAEQEVAIEAPCQTGSFFIQGTFDQVRRERGTLIVVDLKTGASLDGPEMVTYYAAQLCAYMVMANRHLGETIRGAKVVRIRDYLKSRPGPVFWECPWTGVEAEALLVQVGRVVDRVRRGEIDIVPGVFSCQWCSLVSLGNCVRRRDAICR